MKAIFDCIVTKHKRHSLLLSKYICIVRQGVHLENWRGQCIDLPVNIPDVAAQSQSLFTNNFTQQNALIVNFLMNLKVNTLLTTTPHSLHRSSASLPSKALLYIVGPKTIHAIWTEIIFYESFLLSFSSQFLRKLSNGRKRKGFSTSFEKFVITWKQGTCILSSRQVHSGLFKMLKK